MAREKFTIDGVAYASKAAVQRRAQAILKSGVVGGDDARFLLGLFERHPSAAEKIGVGIAEVRVVTVPPWNTRGFQVERVDGTTTDVSYLECLRPTGPEHWFRAACRTAVRDQIESVRAEAFRTDAVIACPITGALITAQLAHVDHAPPWPFERIVAAFLETSGIDPAAVAFVDGDNQFESRFADPALAERFALFHAARAGLRVVSAAANLSDLRRGGR